MQDKPKALHFLVQDAIPPTKNELTASRRHHREERKSATGMVLMVAVGALIAQALLYAAFNVNGVFAPLNATGFELPPLAHFSPAVQGHALMWVMAGLGAILVFGNRIGLVWLAVTAAVMVLLAGSAANTIEPMGIALAVLWVGHLVGWYLVVRAITKGLGHATFHRDAIERLTILGPHDHDRFMEEGSDHPNVRAYLNAVRDQGRYLARGGGSGNRIVPE